MRKRSKMGTQGSEIGGLFNRAVGRSKSLRGNHSGKLEAIFCPYGSQNLEGGGLLPNLPRSDGPVHQFSQYQQLVRI